MNSTCNYGGQFEWTAVLGRGPQTAPLPFSPLFEVRRLPWHCSKITPDLTLHVLSWPFYVVRIFRLGNGRPCHQIWLQFSMSRMKWAFVCASAVTRSAHTLWELGEALREVWQDILQAFLANLMASMRRRCGFCVNVKGGHTHYW